MQELEKLFVWSASSVEAELDKLIPSAATEPERLHEAVRWSVFGGGKRFRPALVIAAGRTFGAPDEKLLRTAAAVEMIHTYSLIHDDLPSMDDDDLRRGRETCHKKFGEATAILAGDVLQALAFQAIASDENLPVGIRLRLVEELALAAAKMVCGQQLDLDAEGNPTSAEDIDRIHQRKTGALIRFAAVAGAIIAEVSEQEIDAMANYGLQLGLLFQITDDLLDVTQSSETLGKTAGKDLLAEKATYPAVLGIEDATQLAEVVHLKAIASLNGIERSNGVLLELAGFIRERRF